MNELNFKESAIDPCLPHKKNVLLVLCVDNAGISAPNKKTILKLVEQLKSLGFDLEIELIDQCCSEMLVPILGC